MDHHANPAPAAGVGSDIRKDTRDACWLLAPDAKPRHHAVANDPNGHAARLAWANGHAPDAFGGLCLESTGTYGEARALALSTAGRHVAVVNPARAQYAGLMRGQGNQTDRADAKLSAEYAARACPPAWQPPRPEVRELQAFTRRRDDRRAQAARAKARLAGPALTAAPTKPLRRTAAFLERAADRLARRADERIAASEALRAGRALLESIPGVGAATAQAILAELPEPGRFATAQQAAAYAGLAPRAYASGTGVRKRTRLSEAGVARLRRALYLPALTAIRFNPLLRGFFERLVGAGKSKLAAVGACLRKLLMIAYGVLKDRTPFDPQWRSKMAS